MKFGFFAFSFIVITINCGILAPLLFIKGKGQYTAQLWGRLTFAAFFWGLGGSIATLSSTPEMAYWGWKIANICSILSPVIFVHFIYAFLDKRNNKRLTFFYCLAFILLAINFLFPKYFFGNVKFVFNEFYYIDWHINKSPVYLLFYLLFYGGLLSHGFYLLVKNYNKFKDPNKKIECKYAIISSLIAWIGAHHDFIAVFFPTIYPYGNILIGFYPISTAYAILRHKFVGIDIFINRSVVYIVLTFVITIIYVLGIYILESLLKGFIGYKSYFGSLSFIIVLSLFSIPLKNRIQVVIDKLFFKATPIQIAAENELLRQEVTQSEKNKAVAALASGIAHEVRNPLTAIKTFYERFPEKKDDPEFIEKFQRITGKEISRIEGLIQQLLDFARPSTPSFQETNINLLIEDTLELLANKLHASKITFTYHPSPSPHHLKVDKNQIKQALLNIFLNAIDAMPTGGQLAVETTINHLLFTIHIKDTGCGIALDDLKHIFDPFFTKKTNGTGLGLAIVQGIVEEHKGKIKVKSEMGKGTEFRIELPVI